MFSRSRTAARVIGIALGAHPPNGGTIGDEPLTLIFELTFKTDGVRHEAGYSGSSTFLLLNEYHLSPTQNPTRSMCLLPLHQEVKLFADLRN